jgi:hypothetical protein
MNPKTHMRCKYLTLLSLAALALVFTGCYHDGAQAQLNKQESYEHTGPNSFVIHSDDLYTRKNFSGDKTTYLWGLVTIEDY